MQYFCKTRVHTEFLDELLEEAFTGKKLDVSHFRIFGTKVYCHVSNDSKKKLEHTTKKGIFVGYNKTIQAY